jgi:hypothetical protein
MRIDWNHILLDPTVYARAGTYRVARVPGSITAFPIGRFGNFEYSGTWSPSEIRSGLVPDAEAPPAYYYINSAGRVVPPGERLGVNDRAFRFAFWSYQGVSGRWGRVLDRRPELPDVVKATAYFVWDLGSGPGPHGVYLDAFHTDTGQFLPDPFVSVAPDDDDTRTPAANNGLLMTEAIEETTVTAHTRLPRDYDLSFSSWELAYAPSEALSRGLVPEQSRNTLTVRSGYLGYEFAFYKTEVVPPLSKPDIIPYGWQNVISGQAGGTLIIVGGTFPTGERGPRGPEPGDTYIPGADQLKSQADAQRQTERRNASLAFAAMFFALAIAAAIASALVPVFQVLFIAATGVFAALGTASAIRSRSVQDKPVSGQNQRLSAP